MLALQSRVTSYTLKETCILISSCRFCYIISKHLFTNESEQKHTKTSLVFFSWLVHSSLYSLQSYSITTRPQRLQPQHIDFDLK